MSLKKASRIITSSDRALVTAEELNELFIRSGESSRQLSKLNIALDYALVCVSARLMREKTLVGFARLGGDGVFQATIWDFVVDPALTHPEATKRLIVERLKREVKQRYSKCCISIFSTPEDYSLFNTLGFSEDDKGIRGMQLPPPSDPFTMLSNP